MFSDKFGLTRAVEYGRKTVTRRLVTERDQERALRCLDDYAARGVRLTPYEALAMVAPYQVGDIVAVPMSYMQIYINYIHGDEGIHSFVNKYCITPGWTNKMFVKADECPLRLRIDDVRVELVAEITNADCMREGVCACEGNIAYYIHVRGKRANNTVFLQKNFADPQDAFGYLFAGSRWAQVKKENPLVYRYEVHVVKSDVE